MDWKDAYIRNSLSAKGVQESEMQAASEFVHNNLDESGDNLNEVLNDLSFHFDLDNRQQTEQPEEASVGEGDEDMQDYKALAEQYEEQLNEMKNREVETMKRQMLTDAGYSQVQADYYGKYIEGDNEESLRAGIDQLRRDVRPASEVGDPNPMNHAKQKAPKTTKKDLQELGSAMYGRIRHKRHY